MATYLVKIRATHPHGYRSGEWGIIHGVKWLNNRPCYEVVFLDGSTDYWPVHDSSDPYEFASLTPPKPKFEEIL